MTVALACLSDLEGHLERHPLPPLCWYGPRASDVTSVELLLQVRGLICCYSAATPLSKHLLTADRPGLRPKCSVDHLAAALVADGRLGAFCRTVQPAAILPYDTTPELESYCAANGLACLSARDALKVSLGDKTRIDEVSRAVGLQPIKGVTGCIDAMEFGPLVETLGLPLFLHFAEGAGGTGNHIVCTEDEFEAAKILRRGKRLNAKQYVRGISCSIDICVTPRSILCGPLEEMLIGSPPLNSNPTEYVGSSWFHGGLSEAIRAKAQKAAMRVGAWARNQGFLGFFHPDFLVCEGKLFLTELNMRFGGSCGTFTQAELGAGRLPLMMAHALVFLQTEVAFDEEAINAQGVQPLDWALIALKNTGDAAITINGSLSSGVYRCTESGIESAGTLNPSAMNAVDEVLLIGLPPAGLATKIEAGAFICQIATRFPISDGASDLSPRGRELVHLILRELKRPAS